MAHENDDVLIIGGGIAGLVLAQGLKYRGIPFRVFERNEHLLVKSHGYRFRCEAAGLEALEETLSPEIWDLIERTHPKDSPPVMTLLDPYTSDKKAEINAVQDPSPRAQRCYPIDRNWFRELCCIGINIHFDKSFESYEVLEEDSHRKVRVRFADGTTATGRLLVAADGVRSRVRQQMLPDMKLVDLDRMVLWGRTPWTPELVSQMPSLAFSTHIGTAIESDPATRCILWSAMQWPQDLPALSDGKLSPQADYVFWVLSTESKKALIGRDAKLEDQLAWVETVVSKWDPALQTLFQKQDPSALSALPVYSSCPDLPKWETNPCVTFIGDSMAGMSPTGGVAGRVAMEDARDLCMAIVQTRDGNNEVWRKRLEKYEDGMRTRASVAIEQAFNNAKFLWGGKDWREYARTI